MSFGTWEGHTIAELRAEARASASLAAERRGPRLPAARRGIAARGRWRASAAGRRELAAAGAAGRRRLAQGRDPRPAGAGDRLGHDRPAAAQARLALPALLHGARRWQRHASIASTCRSMRRERASSSTCSTCWASAICAAPPPWRAPWRPAASTCCWCRAARRCGPGPGCGALPSAAAAARGRRRRCASCRRLDGTPLDEAFRAARVRALLDLLRAEAPDILITEQFPFGRTRLRFELLPLLEAAQALQPTAADRVARCATWCAARPRRSGSPRRSSSSKSLRLRADPWRSRGSYDFERSFAGWDAHQVACRSTPAMSRSTICRSGPATRDAGRQRRGRRLGRAAAPSARRCCEAASPARPQDGAGRSDLAAAGRREHAGGERAALARRRTGIVDRAGARRLHDAAAQRRRCRSPRPATTPSSRRLCCADRAVLVPFGTARETEQADRAALLAERGMVAVVPPGTLSPDSLADAVGRALAGPSLRSFPPCDAQRRAPTPRPRRCCKRLRHEQLGRPSTRKPARWREAGRTAELWWRDDDAADASAGARPAARRSIADPGAAGACGRAGARHAGAGRSPGRRAGRRPAAARLRPCQPCAAGRKESRARPAPPGHGRAGRAGHRLAGAGAAVRQPRRCRVLVPPWNRIAPGLVPTLPEIGFSGLSTFGPRRRARPVRGLLQVNTHVDLIDWKGGRGFVGEEAALAALVAALARARTATDEPVGLLSHHLAMDGEAWDFLRSMWEKSTDNARHPHLRRRTSCLRPFVGRGGRG